MTKDGQSGITYTFDDRGRLYKVTGISGDPWCYVYDGNGLRVGKKSGGTGNTCSGGTVTKLYWRSISGDSLTETDGSGSVSANYSEYVLFAGRRIASRVTGSNSANTALFYYFADQLGSTRTITTGSGKNNDGSSQIAGQLCYDQDYTPYGQEVFTAAQMSRLQTTACTPSYKFTGYERDSETGLDYAFARFYSSRLGRFLSTDPLGGSIGDLQSNNAYSYTANSPINFTDPAGLRRRHHRPPVAARHGTDCTAAYAIISFSGGGCGSGGFGDCTIKGGPADCGTALGLLNSGVASLVSLVDPVSGGTAVFLSAAMISYSSQETADEEGNILVEPSWGILARYAGVSMSIEAWLKGFYNSYEALSDEERLSIVAKGVVNRAGAIGDWRFIAGWYLASALAAAPEVIASEIEAGPLESNLFGRFANEQGGGFPGFLNDPSYSLRLSYGWNNKTSQMVFRLAGDHFGGFHVDLWTVLWP
jgi:RHS repeat-associated protein